MPVVEGMNVMDKMLELPASKQVESILSHPGLCIINGRMVLCNVRSLAIDHNISTHCDQLQLIIH